MPSSFSTKSRSSFSVGTKAPKPPASTTGFEFNSNVGYLTGVGQRLKTILGLGKDITRETLRSVASVPGTISQALPGGQDELKIPRALQPFFGKEPIPSVSRRIAEGEIKATE